MIDVAFVYNNIWGKCWGDFGPQSDLNDGYLSYTQ